VDGCERRNYAKTFCELHYKRWRKHGHPGISLFHAPAEERFWLYISKQGSIPEYRPELGPCWLWTGGNDRRGYGRFSDADQRQVLAHRFAYELLVGPIPEGLDLDHLCRVPACVNPAHLEPVTNAENHRRGAMARRERRRQWR